jgi:putative serine protease PepD
MTPEIDEVPAVPGVSPAPTPPGAGGGSSTMRRLLGGAVALAVLAGAAVTVLLVSSSGSSKPHVVKPVTLTPAQISAAYRNATVMVVARSTVVGSSQLGSGGVPESIASGWVFSKSEGLIVTNAHAINADTLTVGFGKSSQTPAKVLGVDLKDDVAVLEVPPAELAGLAQIPLAAPSSVHVGDTACALGYPPIAGGDPLESPFQETCGTVSADQNVNLQVNTDEYLSNDDNALQLESNMLETTAAINPGNSGGPLINAQGQLIGMATSGSGNQSQGAAIKVDTLDQVLPTLTNSQSIGWPGFSTLTIPSRDVSELGLDPGGVVLTAVSADTPAAAKLGPALTDATNSDKLIIVDKINDAPVTDRQEYVDALRQLQSGEQVKLEAYTIDSESNTSDPGTVAFMMP